ncbi:MAG: hypothetical protein ACREQD_15420, partial [Candidatus Binataceae bacterium]
AEAGECEDLRQAAQSRNGIGHSPARFKDTVSSFFSIASATLCKAYLTYATISAVTWGYSLAQSDSGTQRRKSGSALFSSSAESFSRNFRRACAVSAYPRSSLQ